MSKHEFLLQQVERMRFDKGYDAVIVCTSNESQENYWQERLSHGRGQIIPNAASIIAVHEDWEGGAGNGLGTLYAVEKAIAKHRTLTGRDLLDELVNGASVALFHTAGKGTRLAPLPGSENNNKPGVKLPASILVNGVETPMTILEAVIKQTGLYAGSRKGRISVYWGDQVFIPSVPTEYIPTHHVDILCSLGPMATEQEWKQKSLDKYGLIFENAEKNAAQLEKVTHSTAVRMLKQWGQAERVGTSLGSFSLSVAMLKALLKEFSQELASKGGKLDTDPHFWMPITLGEEAYVELMETKGTSKDAAKSHYARMQKFLSDFKLQDATEFPIFGAVDIGKDVYWWDYGRLSVYYDNNMMITKDGPEAEAMRRFFGIQAGEHRRDGDAVFSSSSVALNSDIKRGRVQNCVLNNVHVGDIDVENSILINVTATCIRAKNAILYNVVEEDSNGIDLDDGGVRADVVIPSDEKHEVIRLFSNLSICGGKTWSKKLDINEHTFEDVYQLNRSTDITEAEKSSLSRHDSMRDLS